MTRLEDTRVGIRKDYDEVIAAAVAQGFRLGKRGKGGKATLYAPDGVNMVRCAATPSEYRGLPNLISQLRKHGFVWKGH